MELAWSAGAFSLFFVSAAVVFAWGLVLVWWDVTHRRLPDWLTLPAGVICIVFIVVLGQHQAWWGLVWPALYFLLGVVQGGIGGGDIKLALPLGLGVAWGAGLWGVLCAIALSALLTVVIGLGKRSRRPEKGKEAVTVAHGPSMLAAAALTVAVSALLATSGGA